MGGYKFRRIAALLVISLVLSLIGAGAGSAEPRPSALEPPTVLEKGDKNLALLPSQVFGENDDPRDPSTFARATRRMIEATWNIDLADPAGIESESVRSSSSVAKGTIRSAMPAGDINGDGLPDVLSSEYSSVDYSRKIVALNGFDGSELWTYALASYDLFPLPVGDLTGDGTGDVLFMRYVYESSPGGCSGVLVAYACSFDSEYTWSHELRSGPTGELIWSRDWSGGSKYISASGGGYVAFAGAGSSTYTNAFLLPIVSDDHSGDGLPDLVINRYDVTWTSTGQFVYLVVGGSFTSVGAPIFTTTAELLDGADGDTFYSVGPVNSGARLLPSGDAVGDETGDLLWASLTPLPQVLAFGSWSYAGVTAFAAEAIMQLDLIDGRTLQTIWSVRRSNGGYFSTANPLLEDLTGDGRADIFIVETGTQACISAYVTSECSASTRHGVMGGSDGALHWQGDGWIYPIVIGAVGGEPGQDLLAISTDYSSDQQTVSIKRVDGATGNLLFATTHASTEMESVYASALGGDADGDAIDDVLVRRSSYSSVGSASIRVESGRSGETIFAKSLDTGSHWAVWDPDGDGLTDLAVISVQATPEETQIAISSIDVPSGFVTWERTDSHPGSFYADILRIGDQSGAGGDDLIYRRATWNSSLSRFDSLDGATGDVRWGYGDVLLTSELAG